MSDSESLDYFQPDFDPWSLTVPRLRSILVTHNVQYPSTAKKSQLVEIFNDQVLPQRKSFLARRVRAKRTSRGIYDADSQNPLQFSDDDAALQPPAPSVGATRARNRSVEPEQNAPPPPPSVTRQSRRQRSSRSRAAQASDTETTDAEVLRPTRRSRRTTPAPAPLEPTAEEEFFKRTPETESIFTNDNPFQSGATSPVKILSNRRRTTTSGMEATPSRKRANTPRRQTDLPRTALYADEAVAEETPKVSKHVEVPISQLTATPRTPDHSVVEAGEEFTPDEQLELDQAAVTNAQRAVVSAADESQSQSLVRVQATHMRKTKRFSLAAPMWGLAVIFLAAYAGWYRQEKIRVGYCSVGRPGAADILPPHIREQVPDWAVSLIEPSCEPCPQHAYCFNDFRVECEPDFILIPHPLAFGSLVPLPPTCEPDGDKVRRVRAVADKAVEELRERRAAYECGLPVTVTDDRSGTETTTSTLDSPAIDEWELRKTISKKRSRRMSSDEFDDLWEAAIGDIKGRSEVKVETEVEEETGRPDSAAFPGTFLSTTSLARLPLTCTVQRSIRLGLVRHRFSIAGVMLALVSLVYARAQYQAHRALVVRVPALVDIALERLAAQKELAFDTGHDDAFLFLPNLRDDLLRATHSLAERERIWKRVRAVVEQNSNVRTGQREAANGEVGRAWEWIGPSSAGALEGGARRRRSGRISWMRSADNDEEGGEGSVNADSRRWEEARPVY